MKQNIECTVVKVKQCCCLSTVQLGRISGLAHEQKLVTEMSREETEERNCSEVCLWHPEAPLMNDVIRVLGDGRYSCFSWVVPLTGLIFSPSFVSWSIQVVS